MAQTMWCMLNTCFSTGALEFGNVLARGCSRDQPPIKTSSRSLQWSLKQSLPAGGRTWLGGALCVTPLTGGGGNKPEEDCTWFLPLCLLLFPCDSPASLSHSCNKSWPWIQLHTTSESSQRIFEWESGMVNTPLYPQNPAQYLTFCKWFTTYFLKGKWKWPQRTRAKAILWKFSKELRNRTYQLHSNNLKNVHTSKKGRMKLIQES